MKTIVFFNNKGGVGKTASVTTVSHMLASKYNRRVLIVDLDPQMNTTTMFNRIDFLKQFFSIYSGDLNVSQKTVQDILLNRNQDIHEVIYKTEYENMDIIPALLTLSEAEELMKADVKSPQQFRLKTHLRKVSSEYDYCIIDTSPSISIININGLVAADQVYIPIRCDGGSLLGVAITMNLCETVAEYNPSLEIGGMFFTQWNRRKNVSQAVYSLLQENFEEFLLPITIRTSKMIEEGTLMQKPLLAYDTSKKMSPVTEDYMALTEYILHHA